MQKKRILCFSDTHIGLPISGVAGLDGAPRNDDKSLCKGLAKCDEAWLLGDLFEGTLTLAISRPKLLEIAKATLKRWDEANPRCKKHFIWGNHEEPVGLEADSEVVLGLAGFRAELLKYIKEAGLNYEFHEKGYIAEGDIVAAHGHIQTMEKDTLPDSKSLGFQILYYSASSIPILSAFKFNPEQVASGTYQWLKGVVGEGMQSVKHMIYGHTHSPTMAKKYDKLPLLCYNTGSSIDKSPSAYNPIIFEIENGKAENIVKLAKFLKQKDAVDSLAPAHQVQI